MSGALPLSYNHYLAERLGVEPSGPFIMTLHLSRVLLLPHCPRSLTLLYCYIYYIASMSCWATPVGLEPTSLWLRTISLFLLSYEATILALLVYVEIHIPIYWRRFARTCLGLEPRLNRFGICGAAITLTTHIIIYNSCSIFQSRNYCR